MNDAATAGDDLDQLFEQWQRYLLFWDRVRADAPTSAAAARLYAVFLDYRTAQLARVRSASDLS